MGEAHLVYIIKLHDRNLPFVSDGILSYIYIVHRNFEHVFLFRAVVVDISLEVNVMVRACCWIPKKKLLVFVR